MKTFHMVRCTVCIWWHIKIAHRYQPQNTDMRLEGHGFETVNAVFFNSAMFAC